MPLVNAQNPHTLAIGDERCAGETIPKPTASVNATSLLSGRLTLVSLYLPGGLEVSKIRFYAGATGLSVGSNQWFCLYSFDLNKLCVTADDTSTAWAANTYKELTITGAPYLVPDADLYYVGICIVATTVPTLAASAAMLTSVNSTGFIKAGTSNTGLTNPASAPTTATALTPLASAPLSIVTL